LLAGSLLAGCTLPASTPPAATALLPESPAANQPAPALVTPSVAAASPASTAVPPVITASLSPAASTPEGETVVEQPVRVIPLAGPLAGKEAEISGMAWYGDHLLLLPQYPGRFGSGPDGALFYLPKAAIEDFLSGRRSGPLEPHEIPLTAPGLAKIQGFEGLEAIALDGDAVYATIEAKPNGMLGYLVSGRIAPDLRGIILNTGLLAPIQPQADLPNMTDEALLVAGRRLITLYAANGANVNPAPVAHLFDLALQPQGTISMTRLEYRVTDATSLDDSGRFWVVNYFFPGDALLNPASDTLAEDYGEGPTHARSAAVERLVELQLSEDGIVLADAEPIPLQLADDQISRDWEAVARLDDLGFLLAADQNSGTILGFVAIP
jgi:hypothetical protein